jgi:hypothetical protein
MLGLNPRSRERTSSRTLVIKQHEVDGIYWKRSLVAVRLALPIYGRLAVVVYQAMQNPACFVAT